MSEPEDEFFVGYFPTPPRLRRFLLAGVAVIAITIAATAILLAGRQRDPGPGKWDLEHPSAIDGLLLTRPYPMLRTSSETILLVGTGKHGVADRVSAYAGKLVRVAGHSIDRSGLKLLELDDENAISPASNNASIAPEAMTTPQTAHPRGEGQGARGEGMLEAMTTPQTVHLRGEIFDPKCFCGAMKPGDGKTHKACASLCIRGGIPPAFLSSDGRHLLIIARDGAGLSQRQIEELIPFVGDLIELNGELSRLGDLELLWIDPASIHRL